MSSEVLEKLYNSYRPYYSLKISGKDDADVASPFCAEAEFKSHTEKYVLVKSAKIADIDSNEYVYFYDAQEVFSIEKVKELSEIAWITGLSKVKPAYGHRNTDITLILICPALADDAKKTARKINFYKSYKFGIYGWSRFRLCVYDDSASKCYTNRFADDIKKLFL